MACNNATLECLPVTISYPRDFAIWTPPVDPRIRWNLRPIVAKQGQCTCAGIPLTCVEAKPALILVLDEITIPIGHTLSVNVQCLNTTATSQCSNMNKSYNIVGPVNNHIIRSVITECGQQINGSIYVYDTSTGSDPSGTPGGVLRVYKNFSISTGYCSWANCII